MRIVEDPLSSPMRLFQFIPGHHLDVDGTGGREILLRPEESILFTLRKAIEPKEIELITEFFILKILSICHLLFPAPYYSTTNPKESENEIAGVI